MPQQQEDQKLNQIVNILRSEFKPSRLFLYGSRANGTYNAESDYDFVMVLPEFDSKLRYSVMSEISARMRNSIGSDVQVWVYSEAQFGEWKNEFSSIPETALNTGREIDLV